LLLTDCPTRIGASPVVVCGCGESLRTLKQPHRFTTIGVNDVGRLFDPDYLVVIDGPEHLKDRYRYVAQSRARYVFTSRPDLLLDHAPLVRFRVAAHGEAAPDDPIMLPLSAPNLMTPFIAVCLAIHMGAKNIGLIGVDLTDTNFAGTIAQHQWATRVETIDAEFDRLRRVTLPRGVRIFNLSPVSRLTSLPKMDLATFAKLDAPKLPPLNIVSYATTPLVGVPATLARCINARTPHRARCVAPSSGYVNGISFDGDISWCAAPSRAKTELEDADIVIIHNGKVDSQHQAIIDRKSVVTVAHNYMANVDDRLVRKGFAGLVVAQYQATLPEFAGWTAVPNPMPLWESGCQPALKCQTPTIAYTPVGAHDIYPRGHPLYWHSKGFTQTHTILDRLAARHDIRLEVVRHGFAASAHSFAMKQRAHIVIDECVTGSYHRNSLEGLAAGCVVVNGVGLLPGVEDSLLHAAGSQARNPFVCADLESLEAVLELLIGLGPDVLAEHGLANRLWLERHWDFAAQWQRFWQPAIDRSLLFAGTCGERVAA
jgi:hypothetical protein